MYNFLYINTHDTGKQISPYGYAVDTNNLLNLSMEGTLFTSAFCCGPTCSPSRASLLTGTYPHQNGMYGLAQRGFGLNDPKMHLANHLKNHGYHTAISGIQHEVGWYLDIDNNALHNLGYEDVLTTPSEKYSKEELCDWDKENVLKAIDWINNYKDNKPFMLTYGLHSTHRPFPEKDEDIDDRYVTKGYGVRNCKEARNDYARYLTSAKYADENIGMLIEAIKSKGLYDNTIILFTTDHGLANPFNKCSLYDRGTAVSLIIRHPKYQNGKVYEGLVSHIDIYPTICDLLKIEKPDYLEGKSFYDYFVSGEEMGDEAIYSEINFHTSYEPARCVRTKRYKYIRYYDQEWDKYNLSNMDDCPSKTIVLEDGIREKRKVMEGLYDCVFDEDEKNNLINDESMSQVLAKMRELLDKHLVDTKDPILDGPFEIKPNYKVNKKECILASSKDPEDYDSRGRC